MGSKKAEDQKEKKLEEFKKMETILEKEDADRLGVGRPMTGESQFSGKVISSGATSAEKKTTARKGERKVNFGGDKSEESFHYSHNDTDEA